MVSYLDHSVGRVERALKSRQMWDSSLIVFATDNGGATGHDADVGNNWPLRGAKYADYEGGVRGVCFVTGGVLPVDRWGLDLTNRRHRVSIADWYATFVELAGGVLQMRKRPKNACLPWTRRVYGRRFRRGGRAPLARTAADGARARRDAGKWRWPHPGPPQAPHRQPEVGGAQWAYVPKWHNTKAARRVLQARLPLRSGRGSGRGPRLGFRKERRARGHVDALPRVAKNGLRDAALRRLAGRSAMARHIAVVERDYAGFWGPYTSSLSAVERAGFVDGNFQPWDKHHRPDLVEAQKKRCRLSK